MQIYYLSFEFSSSISSAKISNVGSKNSCWLAMVLSNESNKAGNKIKFESIAKSKVVATNPPKATVPPKLDNLNTENPKNNTTEV